MLKFKSYQINHLAWLLKDRDDLDFHLQQRDYFGTLAAILKLINNKLEENKTKTNTKIGEILTDLEKDLSYLQDNYQIIPKTKNKNKTPKGKEISQ